MCTVHAGGLKMVAEVFSHVCVLLTILIRPNVNVNDDETDESLTLKAEQNYALIASDQTLVFLSSFLQTGPSKIIICFFSQFI